MSTTTAAVPTHDYLTAVREWWRGLVLRVGTWLVAWATPVDPAVDPIDDAVRHAFARCGLPAEQYRPGFDLSRTGKLYEVLHYASVYANIDHELRTVGDVVRFFKTP